METTGDGNEQEREHPSHSTGHAPHGAGIIVRKPADYDTPTTTTTGTSAPSPGHKKPATDDRWLALALLVVLGGTSGVAYYLGLVFSPSR